MSHVHRRLAPRARSVLMGAAGVLCALALLAGGIAFAVAPTTPSEYNLSQVLVVSRAISYIKNNYYDPGRIQPLEMTISGLRNLERQVAEVVVQPTPDRTSVRIQVDEADRRFDLSDVDSVWDVIFKFQEIFEFVQPHLRSRIEPRDIEYGVVNGILDTLDPHSVMMPPRVYNEVRLSTQGNFGGLGIVIGIRDAALTIIAPYEDTPAWRAGLKARDRIVMIDGRSTVNMDLNEAVNLMRGEPNTRVTLTIMREGWQRPRDFPLVRAIINIRSVVSALYQPGNIAHVRIKNFQSNTFSDLQAHLQRLTTQAGGTLGGIILDFRGNPGGLMQQAIVIADQFLTSGVIVSTVGVNNTRQDVQHASYTATQADVPLVVLVDGSSASASEIVAGALKHNNRAVVVGERTFGKGSVQMIYDFDDSSALKLTINQYLTPGDISIQSVGIPPDIELIPVTVEPHMIDFFADHRRRREADLDHALRNDDQVADSQSRFEVHYLWDERRDGINPDQPPSALQEDYQAQFAAALLRGSPGVNDRQRMLDRAAETVERLESQQIAEIVRALGRQGIDWSAGTADQPGGQATVALAIRSRGPAPEASAQDRPLPAGRSRPRGPAQGAPTSERIQAGDEAEITLTVTNSGTAPLHRLRALTRSEYALFNAIELFIGRLDPGQTRTATTWVDVPQDVLDRVEPVLFSFHEQYGRAPADQTVDVRLHALPAPKFAFSWQVDDTAQGNGNGLIEPEETVSLIIDVTNVGDGPVRDGQVSLHNAENVAEVFIEEGRAELDGLAPNETRTFRLKFTLRPGLTRTAFPMDINLLDMAVREFVTYRHEFNVAADAIARPPVADRAGWLSLPAGACLRPQPDAALPCFAEVGPSGAVLASVRAVGPFTMVRFGDRRVGFADAGDFAAQGRASGEVALRMTMRTPRIAIDEGSAANMITDADSFVLKGVVVDDNRLQDIYILAREQKVMFRANPAPTDPARLSMPFEASVPLRPGINRITVVARESDQFVSNETLVVFRRSGTPDAGPDEDPDTGSRGGP